jgi:hypothetical protein
MSANAESGRPPGAYLHCGLSEAAGMTETQ